MGRPLVNEEEKGTSVHVIMTPELAEKLDEVAKTKYRGVRRSQAIKWMIEDTWMEYRRTGHREDLRLELDT